MKTGNILLKALVIGGVIVSAANFSNEVFAATPLDTAKKGSLDTAGGGATLKNNITAMLLAAPAADREQLAKDIVAYLAAKPGVSRDVLTVAVRAAVSAVPGKAAGIASAAAQAAVNGNASNQTALVLAIAMGAAQGAPTELTSIRDALFAAVPSIDQGQIVNSLNAGASSTNDTGPSNQNNTDQNQKDTTTSQS